MLTKEQYRSSWYRNLTQREKDIVNAKAYFRSLLEARSKMAKKTTPSKQLENLTPHQRARIWYKEQQASAPNDSSARPVALVDSAAYDRVVFTESRQQAEESPVLRRRSQPSSTRIRPDPSGQFATEEDENHPLVEESVERALSTTLIDPPTRPLSPTLSKSPRVQPEEQQLRPVSSNHQQKSSHPVWSQKFSAWHCIIQAAAACIIGPEATLGVFSLMLAYGAIQSMWNKPHQNAADSHQYSLSERPNEAVGMGSDSVVDTMVDTTIVETTAVVRDRVLSHADATSADIPMDGSMK